MPPLILGWGAIALCLVLSRRPDLLLAGDTILAIFNYSAEAGGVDLDLRDVTFAALTVAFFLRMGRPKGQTPTGIPHLRLWIAYGVLSSLAYLAGPANSADLTGPVAVGYQLYRYCWKPVLYYPLALWLLVGERPSRVVLGAMIAAADVCAIQGILEGYAGEAAVATFTHKNELAGVLLIPMIMSLRGFLDDHESRRVRFFCLASAVVIARALLIVGSRGAFFAGLVAVGVFFLSAVRIPSLRRRITRLAAAGALVVALFLGWNFNLADRPALQQTLTVFQLSKDDNLQWRTVERWPLFWSMMLERPFLGWGTEEVRRTDQDTTAHNGFLAVAVRDGIPALLLYSTLILLGLRQGVRTYFSAESPHRRLLAAAVAASILAVVVHDTVEATFGVPSVAGPFWMVVGIAAGGARMLSSAAAKG